MSSWMTGVEANLKTVSGTDRHGKPLTTLIDLKTGVVRNDPIPDDATLAKFYSDDYRVAYKSAARPRGRQILRNFRRAKQVFERFDDVFAPARTMLDAGAGSGEFLFAGQYLGKDAIGVEPNREYAEYDRQELGLNVTTKHLSEELFAQESFDLIILSHVLEHLNDPVRYLSMLAGWLTPRGVLYIEVPDINEMCARHSVGNMFHFGHIFNYSPSVLRIVAGLSGLVELDATRARCADSTSVVFVKGPALAQFPDNSAAAAHTLSLIARHYAKGFKEGKAAKPFRKLGRHLEESVNSKIAGSAKEIGQGVMSGKIK